MKHLVLALAILLFFASPALSQEPEISADAAILIDLESNQILYSKNSSQKRAIASTTKVLTAILAIEKGDLKDIVAVSPEAASIDESTIYLEPNEKLSLEDLLYGALLRSGNDACVAIAEHISGKEQDFIKLMNTKARLLGTKNSNFANTNGLPNEEHYSTAYDLGLIASYALKNMVFSKIVATKYKVIKNDDNIGKNRYLKNTNKLLWQYPGTDGVKTGTTDKAGRCLIASATRDNRSLLVVLLHSDNREEDGKRLLEYGFNNFINLTLLKEGEEIAILPVEQGVNQEVKVIAKENLIVSIPKNNLDQIEKKLSLDFSPKAPIEKGQKIGDFKFNLNQQTIKASDLVAEDFIEKKSKVQELVDLIKEFG